ncbi:MAG: 16S rRNA (adenine(1518)-N(6)/adenine(1519)-N(6))-dimethyltransferase RsmA [Candidatus Saccharimonadales bacterium]
MSDLPSARKSLGQHWLQDEDSLRAICEAAQLKKDDVVLEIGPGPGTLTRLLTEKAARVVAVELDEELAADLPRRVNAGNLEVVQQDILRFDLGRLPAGYKVVANIPYYLTGKLLRVLSDTANPPAAAVLLLQKEVAERAAAGPGSMSILSVTAQFYWQVKPDRVIPAAMFVPAPRVDSQILVLRRRAKPLFDDVEPGEFFRIVKAGFAQPRKTLLNNLAASMQLSQDEARTICERGAIDPGRRAQTLSLEEWRSLYRSIHT